MSLCFSSAEGVLCLLSPAVLAHEAEGEFAAVGGGTESVKEPWGKVNFACEEYRRHSLLSDVCRAVLCGLGLDGYKYALDYLVK